MTMQKNSDFALSPPVRLAIAHARADLRGAWAWLLEFDDRLRHAVEGRSDPLLAQMRLAWWRDQLEKPAAQRAKGEPLLAMLSELGTARGRLAEPIEALLTAWEAKAVGTADMNVASGRGEALFLSYADWADASQHERQLAQELAALWTGQGGGWPQTRIPHKLRPLSLLALASQIEQARSEGQASRLLPLRLLWHSLTGG